jgi:hypothetical protein
MPDALILSRTRLLTFLRNPREFQARYLLHQPWPQAPLPVAAAEAAERGRQFHQVVARHLTGVPRAEQMAEGDMEAWWKGFRRFEATLPAGRRFPEMTLTVPLGRHFITGRFDLLIAAPTPKLHIFDWKTERRPRSPAELRDDWQTRFYWALAAAGSTALEHPVTPDQIALTYWFAAAPEATVTFPYSAAVHQRNWEELTRIVDALDRLLREDPPRWPEVNPLGMPAPDAPPEESTPEPAIEPAWY